MGEVIRIGRAIPLLDRFQSALYSAPQIFDVPLENIVRRSQFIHFHDHLLVVRAADENKRQFRAGLANNLQSSKTIECRQAVVRQNQVGFGP